MFIGTCKLRWQEFTSHLMETQSWFSLLLLFELFVPHFVTYWSDYWGFSHHPVAWCEFMSFCVHMFCSLHPRWVSDPLRDDGPFSQICGDRTVNWTLFLDSLKPLRAVLRHYTCHSSLLGSILKVSLYWCNCPPFHKKKKRFIENQISGYGSWWQQKKNAEFNVCVYSRISGVIVAGDDGELAVINLSSI